MRGGGGVDVQTNGTADGDAVEVGGDLVAARRVMLERVEFGGSRWDWTYLGPYLDL